MLLPSPDVSSLPMDGSFTPGVLAGPADVSDPTLGDGTIQTGWSATIQDILSSAATAAQSTYLPGTPATGIPPATRPHVVTATPVSHTLGLSTSTILIAAAVGVLAVVLAVTL